MFLAYVIIGQNNLKRFYGIAAVDEVISVYAIKLFLKVNSAIPTSTMSS